MIPLVSTQTLADQPLRLRGACLALPRISFPRFVSFHSCLRPVLVLVFLSFVFPFDSLPTRLVFVIGASLSPRPFPPISNPCPRLDRRATPITKANTMAAPPTRQWGVTPPISTALPTQDELVANDNLIAELKAQNNFEAPSETERRWAINQPKQT